MVLRGLFQPRRRAEEARLAHALRDVPLFRDAPADDLVEVWRCLSTVEVSTGTVLCERGQPGDCLYVVQSGTLEVRLGLGPNSLPIQLVASGDFVGEMALLMDQPRSADVVAVEDAVLWRLERADFDALLSRSTSLLRAMIRTLAERLAQTDRLLERYELGGLDSEVGMRIGPYRVLAQLGAGGMAVVYSAVHVVDGRAAAVKVLPAAWGEAPELRARLALEAAALQRLDHPNVVRVLDVGEVGPKLGGGCYLAEEWLPNGLDRVLRAQYPEPLSVATALRLAKGIADGLEAVHEAGLVHRDLKPSNVLLRADGTPVLADFGLVADLAEIARGSRLTATNVILGTADYLSPEQISGGRVDGRADLYSLGIVLYEMLVGFVPFAGRDPLESLRAHVEEAPPPLPSEIPEPVRAIVERALKKDPEDRFSSAREMADAIAEAAGKVDVAG